jgi:hypothetical protein
LSKVIPSTILYHPPIAQASVVPRRVKTTCHPDFRDSTAPRLTEWLYKFQDGFAYFTFRPRLSMSLEFFSSSNMKVSKSLVLGTVVTVALACDSCYGPATKDIHVRNVRRMQPGAQNATTMPKGPLEWGQINFLHTVSFLSLLLINQRHNFCESQNDLTGLYRLIHMDGWKVISRNKIMALIGETLHHSLNT